MYQKKNLSEWKAAHQICISNKKKKKKKRKTVVSIDANLFVY